jgi:hypothetical protein
MLKDQVVRSCTKHYYWSATVGRGESNPYWLEPKSTTNCGFRVRTGRAQTLEGRVEGI